ncbi:Leucine rich repeat protein [Novymonas esmeraldas]|uniref:Leucine rich repeat protein n=1 Tax=Novymonas esmeraldas TaxID=1808958 RepID=A0AAW0EYF9_9TRYP
MAGLSRLVTFAVMTVCFMTTLALSIADTPSTACGAKGLSATERVNTWKFIQYLFQAVNVDQSHWTPDTLCCADYVACTDGGVAVSVANIPEAAVGGYLPDVPEGIDLLQVVITSIDMSNNWFLEGVLPSKWGSLIGVREIRLGGTMIRGALPPSWSRMASLSVVDLQDVAIAGALPASWGRLVHLETLTLGGSGQIWAQLPGSWGSMRSLRIVEIDRGGLLGTLPESWGSLANLEVLNLETNSLTGSIPTSLGPLPRLHDVKLLRNRFCGCLPSAWSTGSIAVEADSALTSSVCATANMCPLHFSSSSSSSSSSQPSSSSSSSSSSQPSSSSSSSSSSQPSSSSSSSSSSQPSSSSSSSSSSQPSSSSSSSSSSQPSSSSSSSSSQPSSSSSSSATGDCFKSVPFYSSDQAENSLRFLSAFTAAFEDPSATWGCPNFCVRAGVSCSPSGFQLDLSEAVTRGSLPPVPVNCVPTLVPVTKVSAGGEAGGVTLTGSLPPSWGALTSLEELDFSHTGVGGTLPPEWGALASLTWLYLSDNRLTGVVPATWLQLTHLRKLDLSNNDVSGFEEDTQ